jgi:hypothetical protein
MLSLPHQSAYNGPLTAYPELGNAKHFRTPKELAREFPRTDLVSGI